MSRRFGRNQRRRAREAIASQQEQLTALDKQLKREQHLKQEALLFKNKTQQEVRYFAQALKDVHDMLPRFHAALPPDSKEVDDLRVEGSHRMPIEENFSLMHFDTNPSAAVDMVLRTVDAYALVLGTKDDPYRDCLHFRATFDTVDVAYFATKASMADMPRERLVRHLSQTMAEHFIGALEAKGIRPRRTRPATT